MTEHGGTTSGNTAQWRVQICLETGFRELLAGGEFANGVDAKIWMCDQLNLIRFNDRDLRAGSVYSYVGTAESCRDRWQARLVDARSRIVWDSAIVGGRRG